MKRKKFRIKSLNDNNLYVAQLHKGERVQTASEVKAQGKGDVNITLHYTSNGGGNKADAEEIAGILFKNMKESWGGMPG